MSYVLEALKKAEAQRERGAVPNLHDRPLGPQAVAGTVDAAGGRSWRRLAALLAAAVLAVGAVALWWTMGRRGAEPAPVVAASAERDRISLPAPAPAVPTPVPATAIIAPVPPGGTRAVPPPAAHAQVPAPRAQPAERSDDAARPAAVPAASATDSRIHSLEELPDDIRRGLPALVIGGAMHSANPANRMLIVNGQVFHENDPIAPGLTLEQIALNSAVLRTRGYRYRLTY